MAVVAVRENQGIESGVNRGVLIATTEALHFVRQGDLWRHRTYRCAYNQMAKVAAAQDTYKKGITRRQDTRLLLGVVAFDESESAAYIVEAPLDNLQVLLDAIHTRTADGVVDLEVGASLK